MAKRIVFCADGTWNGPEQQTGVTPIDGADDRGELNGAKVTNVVKLFANLAGRVTPQTMTMCDEQEKVVPDAAGGVVLNLPLFAGNLYSARQKEAALRAQAAEGNLRDEENNVIREVRLAWLSAQNAFERSRITAQLLENATLAFSLAQARYDNGASSIVELNQAQLNQVLAEITHTNTRYEYLLQRTVLDFQTGALH